MCDHTRWHQSGESGRYTASEWYDISRGEVTRQRLSSVGWDWCVSVLPRLIAEESIEGIGKASSVEDEGLLYVEVCCRGSDCAAYG